MYIEDTRTELSGKEKTLRIWVKNTKHIEAQIIKKRFLSSAACSICGQHRDSEMADVLMSLLFLVCTVGQHI